MTPEEKLAAAIRPIIKNKVIEEPKPVVQMTSTPVVNVVQNTTKVKIVGRSQYMRDMLTFEK